MKSPYSIKSLPLLYTIPIRRAWTLRFCNTLISSITIASTLLLRIMMFFFSFLAWQLSGCLFKSIQACMHASCHPISSAMLWVCGAIGSRQSYSRMELQSFSRRLRCPEDGGESFDFWTPSAKDTKHAAASYIYFFLCWSVFFFRLLTCSFFLLAARKWYRLANWRRTRSKHKNRILISAKLFYLYYWRPLFNIQIAEGVRHYHSLSNWTVCHNVHYVDLRLCCWRRCLSSQKEACAASTLGPIRI